MLLKDVEKRLEMECTIAVPLKKAMLNVSSKYETYVLSRLLLEDHRTYVQLYFLKNKLPGSLVSLLMASRNVENRPGYYLLTEEITGKDSEKLIDDLTGIPSVMFSSSKLRKSEILLTFRFLRSDIESVNAYVEQLTGDDGTAYMVYLGPSEGIVSMIDSIHGSNPLSVIKFDVDISDTPLAGKFSREDSPVSEADSIIGSESGRKVLLYTESEIAGLENFRVGSGTYLMNTANHAIEKLRLAVFEERTPVCGSYARYSGNKVEATIFVPETETDSFIEILFRQTDALKFQLKLCSRFNTDFWELI